MCDNLQMALEGKYTTTLGGACVTVDYRVCQNNEGQAHFIYLGTDYNFSMTRWKQKAFSPFRAKFHEVYKDIGKYLTSDVDPDRDAIRIRHSSERQGPHAHASEYFPTYIQYYE